MDIDYCGDEETIQKVRREFENKVREEAIQEIQGLYPIDSIYPDVQKTGIHLLEQAKQNTSNWRNLPDETLIEYARLCREEEYRQQRIFEKKFI